MYCSIIQYYPESNMNEDAARNNHLALAILTLKNNFF